MRSIALLSSVIELCFALPALILNFKAALLGIFITAGGVFLLFVWAYYFPDHFFIKRAKKGSSSEAFWKGAIWNSYCISCANRSRIGVLLFDNWAIGALLIYALLTVSPYYSCLLLGMAGAVSAIALGQFFLKPNSSGISM